MLEEHVISSCPSSPSENEHCVDYLIVMDFEATCDNGLYPKITRNNQEMIEFPFVVIALLPYSEIDTSDPNARYATVVHQEQHYIVPQYSTHLTPFCTELTGITDEILMTSGKSLHEVINHFDEYLEKNMSGKRYCIITDGDWDIKQLLLRESKNKGIPLAQHFYEYFDLRREFKKCFPNFVVRGLASMVEECKLNFVGRHHSGLDDCFTIVEIVNYLLRYGHRFVDPVTIDSAYDPFRDTSFQEFHQNLNTQRQPYQLFVPTPMMHYGHNMPHQQHYYDPSSIYMGELYYNSIQPQWHHHTYMYHQGGYNHHNQYNKQQQQNYKKKKIRRGKKKSKKWEPRNNLFPSESKSCAQQ